MRKYMLIIALGILFIPVLSQATFIAVSQPTMTAYPSPQAGQQ
jgi:hypothetical protein